MSKFPETYIIGQEYMNDKQTEVTFKFFSRLSCVFPKITFHDDKIQLYMSGEFLVIEYTFQISQKLFNDIAGGKAHSYIWSYLSGILPYINSEIQKVKYSKGQVLLRTLSFFDVSVAAVFKDNKFVTITKSAIFSDFPELDTDITFHNYIYIRDYIDAITAIFYYNYEEFIRKCITSVENYFIQHGVEKTTFKGALKKVLEPTKDRYGNKTIYNNISYIYDIRNKIVHNTLRVEYSKMEWNRLCHMALASLQYLFLRICSNKDESEYIFKVYLQYCAIKASTDTSLCNILESNDPNPTSKEKKKNKGKNKSLDKIMFDSLVIPKRLKKAIETNA